MSDPIIRVEKVSKRYHIGVGQEANSLRQQVSRTMKGWLRRSQQEDLTAFWALKDLSFTLNRGEMLGIIGHNGAGKSTLLKILSRITEPTSGRVEIHGRVGSLLEVGTGFHPELTGRENVFLNGAILGMKKSEIERAFDQIVDFAELSRFIDTPVKRYSSGMYVRLAFSVASHLQSEILIMDEVLAVGDPSFQFKCMDKMQAVRNEGRTILFVSHNMAAVTRLCTRAILMERGEITSEGSAVEIAGTFLAASHRSSSEMTWDDEHSAPSNDIVRLRRVRVVTDEGKTTEAVDIRRPVGLEMTFEVLASGHQLVPNFHFVNEAGQTIFAVLDLDPEWRRRPRPAGIYVSTAWIPGNFLSEGMYSVAAAVSSHIPASVVHFMEHRAVNFQVVDSLDGDAARGDYHGPFPGVVRPLVNWTTQFNPSSQLASIHR